jgi:hypothetical protein
VGLAHGHMGIQLMKPNETLIESLKSKEFQKCSKTMFNESHVNKWDMHKKTDLKEFMESFTFVSCWKSIKEFEEGESKSKGCKACKMQIIFEG